MENGHVPSQINDIQTCYFWYHGCEPDNELLSVIREDQMLVVTCPESCPKLVEGFKRAGGLVLVYVSIYKAPVIAEVPDDKRKWEGGSPFRSSLESNPYWKEVDLTDHPEWILRDGQGQPRRPFEAPLYMSGWYQTTALAEGYGRAVCRGIEALVHDGRFNGIFLDNVHPTTLPSTVQRAGRRQPAEMKAHELAFYELIQKIRETGDKASRERFWIQTNGSHHEVVQKIADSMLFESFLYSWAWTEPSMDDEKAEAMLNSLAILRQRGGRPIVLPYLGFSGHDIAEDARRVRRIADRANAIFSDMFTLVRPEVVAVSARRCVETQRPEDPCYYPKAQEALNNQSAGNINAAREIYRL
ncbi:MAG: hypothetical protein KKE37_03895 [Verrucomicrobia bacterium]|nr:hypothetical protein [Verrucomicrobiota bacterium]MBU4428479.1 hypothetical protein [Verrucomicrobiota bacterium]MCG2680361.1 hypothetical protein [Kiritimatiellia bacterium]